MFCTQKDTFKKFYCKNTEIEKQQKVFTFCSKLCTSFSAFLINFVSCTYCTTVQVLQITAISNLFCGSRSCKHHIVTHRSNFILEKRHFPPLSAEILGSYVWCPSSPVYVLPVMPRGQDVLWLRWGLRTRRLRVRASRSTALRLGVSSFPGIKPSMFPLYHMIQAPIDINTSTAPEYTNRSPKSRPPISRGTKTPIKRVDTPKRSMRTANTSTNLQWVSPTRSAPDIMTCL